MGRVLRFVVLLALMAYVVWRFTPSFHRMLRTTTSTTTEYVSRPTQARNEWSNAEPISNLDIFNGCDMEGDARSPGVRALDRLKNRYTAPSPADVDSAITLEAILAPGNDISHWKVKESRHRGMGRCCSTATASSRQDFRIPRRMLATLPPARFCWPTDLRWPVPSYAHTGWAIQEALPDQIAVLDAFAALVGSPTRTIAWGHSLGGIITAGLIQNFPTRFDAALPMCGVLSGGVANWNQALDAAFAFKTLLAPGSPLQVVNITNPTANLGLAGSVLSAAQATPQGRARLALALTLADIPGWFDPASPEPAPSDFATQEFNQFLWAQQADLPLAFAVRAELEFRAGGNPSWNIGVNYKKQFAHSVNHDEVVALYAQAGLDLDADLDTLNDAERITANMPSVQYLEQNIIFNGDIGLPVLTLHTTGDGEVSNQNENAYADVVREAGNNRFLRRTFVHRAGHCTFTPAETVTALVNLIQRLGTGRWPDLGSDALNAEAAALGPLNIAVPSFTEFTPAQFLRPFDTFDAASGR